MIGDLTEIASLLFVLALIRYDTATAARMLTFSYHLAHLSTSISSATSYFLVWSGSCSFINSTLILLVFIHTSKHFQSQPLSIHFSYVVKKKGKKPDRHVQATSQPPLCYFAETNSRTQQTPTMS